MVARPITLDDLQVGVERCLIFTEFLTFSNIHLSNVSCTEKIRAPFVALENVNTRLLLRYKVLKRHLNDQSECESSKPHYSVIESQLAYGEVSPILALS